MQIKELSKDKDYVLIITPDEFTLLQESETFGEQLLELEKKTKSLTIVTDDLYLEEIKTIRYKLLHENAKAPFRGHEDDSGFDLTTAWVEPFHMKALDGSDIATGYKLHMGVAVAPPEGYYFEMLPRSSFSKSGYVLGNSVGIIDKGYRGELMAIVHPTRKDLGELQPGDRHFQLVLHKYENDSIILREVEEFEETVRGVGGFGSTGR